MKKSKGPSETYNVRLVRGKKKEAAGLNINMSKLFRETLDEAIKKAKGACPLCGRKGHS